MVDQMELDNVFDKLKYFLLTWFECVAGDNLNVSKDWHKLAVELKVPAKDNRTHLDEDMENVAHYLQEGIQGGELSSEMPVSSVAMDLVFSMYGASFYRCSSYTEFDLIKWSRMFVEDVLENHLAPYRQKQN